MGVLVDAFVVRSLLAPALLGVMDHASESAAGQLQGRPTYGLTR